MTRPFVALGSLALWASVCLVRAVCGQTTAKPSAPFSDNVCEEITLSRAQKARAWNDYGASPRRDAAPVSGGQHVQLIGVVKMLEGDPVFMARAAKLDDQVYTIRNEQGFPVAPRPATNWSPCPGVQP